MLKSDKPRGASPQQNSPQQLPKQHMLAIGGLTVFVTMAALFMPSGDVEANKPAQLADTELAPKTIAAPDVELETSPAPEFAELSEATDPLPEINPWQEQRVKSGDNLSLIFKRAGFNDTDVYKVIHTAPDGKALSKIFPGQTIAFQNDADGQLIAVRHVISPLETVVYQSSGEAFESQRELREPEVRKSQVSGEITSSLFLAGQEAGLSQLKIMDLANIFGGVIDFVLDPRKGDTIHVVYEELFLDGEKFADGDIIAASFTNRGETFNAYRYQDSHGDVGYFNEKGVSMRKAFLLAPVDFTRISSNFNLRRLHPIYKTTRPHRGTDYAASTGTPVYAAGDGKVIAAGYSRANGNYVFLQHGEQYVTKYLHLHKKRVKRGQRVTQSQVIGTVGSTGAATGPHLHYEFLVNGVHRNPRTIHKQLPKAKALTAEEVPLFQQAISPAATQLASLQTTTRLALNQANKQ